MRKINYLVVHCTATHPHTPIINIVNYWKDVLKWNNPGYHYIIPFNGKVVELQDIAKIANGVAGFNKESIHVSYVGGINAEKQPADTRTTEQKEALLFLLLRLKILFPKAAVLGHRDFPNAKKACPSFDVRSWLFESNYMGMLL